MNKSAGLSDYDLLLLLKRKDKNAVSVIYDRYAACLYGYLLKQVRNAKVAADILQRTFVKIYNESPYVDCIKQRLFTWLMSVASKTALEFEITLSPSNQYTFAPVGASKTYQPYLA